MGGSIGGILGGIVGSVVPGIGTALGSAIGGGIGGLMGGGGSATKGTNPSSSSLSQYVVPKDLQGDYKSIMSSAESLFHTPFQPYTGEAVAPFNTDQLNTFQGIRDMQGQYQGMMNSASGYAMNAANQYAGGITSDQISQLMNPYSQNVINSTQRNMLTNFDTQRMNLGQKYAASGAFGGDRQALAEGQLYNDTANQLNDVQYRGMADSYTNAMNAALQNRAGLLTSAQGIASLAGQGQNLGYKDLTALGASGDQQQGNQQALDQFNISQYQNSLNDQQNKLTNFNSLFQGWLPRQGQMTQNPGSPSPLAQALGYGIAGNQLLGSGTPLGSGLSAIGGSLFGGSSGGSGLLGGLLSSLGGVFQGSGGSFADGGIVGYASGGLTDVPTFAQRMQAAMAQPNPLFDTPWVSGINIDTENPTTPFEKDVASGIGAVSKTFQGIKKGTADMLKVLPEDAAASGLYYSGKMHDYFTGDNSLGGLEGVLAGPQPTYPDKLSDMPGNRLNPMGFPAEDVTDQINQKDAGTPDAPQGIAAASATATKPAFMDNVPDLPQYDEPKDTMNMPLLQLGIGLLSTPGNFNFGLAKGMEGYAKELDTDKKDKILEQQRAREILQQNLENEFKFKQLQTQDDTLKATEGYKQIMADQNKLAKEEIVRKDRQTEIQNIDKSLLAADPTMSDPRLIDSLKKRKAQLQTEDFLDNINSADELITAGKQMGWSKEQIVRLAKLKGFV